MSVSVLARPAVDYPSADGKPMAETQVHLACTIYALDVLGEHYRKRPDVYVGGDMLLYYEEGNPRASVAPDVFVVLGAPKTGPEGGWRETYKLWEEPKAPDFVLEVTSRSTRHEDEGRKRDLYASLGVKEYVLCDPRGEYLSPPLQGFRLRGGGYEPLPVTGLSHGVAGLRSAVLGLDFRLEGEELRLHDPATGQDLLDYQEVIAARRKETAARQALEAHLEREKASHEREAAARRAAEARIAELEALVSSRGAPVSPEKKRP